MVRRRFACRFLPHSSRCYRAFSPQAEPCLEGRKCVASRRASYLQNRRGAAYGGTPSDQSVIAAIRDAKARGLKVTLYPFIMMDVPEGNQLSSPYGGIGQPAYPWRGRITCHPAVGVAGSPDKTPAAGEQVQAFVDGQWGYRRFLNHCAELAQQAGAWTPFSSGRSCVGSPASAMDRTVFPSSRISARWPPKCGQGSVLAAGSPMALIGRNISAIRRRMAAVTCSSILTRYGLTRPSMPSVSTITCRLPTGAIMISTMAIRMGSIRPMIWMAWRVTSRQARAMTGITQMPKTARPAGVRLLRMVWRASHGSIATKTSKAGGATGIITALQGPKLRNRRRGYRSRSRSGSLNLAVPQSTRGRTSRMFS